MKRMFVAWCGIACMFTSVCSAQLGAPVAAAASKSKEGDQRVKLLLDEVGLKYKVDSDGDYVLVNDMGEGRTQQAWILSNTAQLGTMEIREVWSVGYRSDTPLSATIANKLLEQNGKVKLGAWHVRKMGGQHVAVFHAQIAAESDKMSLLLALQAVTQTTDEMELELTGKDDY